MKKTEFEERMLNTCNTVADMMYKKYNGKISKNEVWKMAKKLVFGSYNETIENIKGRC